jgi:hypothetical protein
VPHVVAAPTTKSTTTAGGAHITDLRADQQPTTLYFNAPAQATAGVGFDITVRLTIAGGIGIPNAQINIEERFSSNDRWVVLKDSAITDSGGNVYGRLNSPIWMKSTTGLPMPAIINMRHL